MMNQHSRDGSEHFQLDDIKKTIWLTRPDLQELFGGDRDRFEWWLISNGVGEYQALAECAAPLARETLTEPAPEAWPHLRPTLTRFMKMVWSMRPDLQQVFDLGTREGQEAFVWWYFIHGVGELGLSRFLTDEQCHQLNEADPGTAGTGFLPITRLMSEIWRRRPDLQQIFDLRQSAGCDAFLEWYFVHGIVEFGLASMISDFQVRMLQSLLMKMPQLRPAIEAVRKPMLPAVCRASPDLPYGVNLIGYPKGQFGLGEDVRMAALALEAAGIPFSIYNTEPGSAVCQGDESAMGYVSGALPFATNIFCTTGFETARLAVVHGSRIFDGRRSIGYWPWELSDWPEDWHHAYKLVDEVWASSRFTYDAFARSSPKPVRHMPMAVTVDRTAGLTRREFQLPDGHFLFVCSFDFLSFLSRKNPQACIAAFQMAFPRGDEPVGLVVKVTHARRDDPHWQALLVQVRADARIIVIDATLNRGELLDLYRVCDCLVSLHRSEGFGRNLAEAMLLGKPVITTGYSGNMDFTLPGTAGLVDHRLRLLAKQEYPFGDGLSWAEPDSASAAWWMQRLANDRLLRERLVRTAQVVVSNTYTPQIVGASYRAVL